MAKKPAQTGRSAKRSTAPNSRDSRKTGISAKARVGRPVGAKSKGTGTQRRQTTKAAQPSREARAPAIDVMALHDELVQELSGHQERMLEEFRAKLEALEHEVATLRDEVTKLSNMAAEGEEEEAEAGPPSEE